ALEVDEGVGAAPVLRAAAAAVVIAAGVDDGHDHGLGPRLDADVVLRHVPAALAEGEHGRDVVGGDPGLRLGPAAGLELPFELAAAEHDALLAAGLGVRRVKGLVGRLPDQVRGRARVGPTTTTTTT